MSKETPISKYLATLERRQAQMNSIFGMATGSPSPSPSPNSRNPLNVRQRLRFDDETFLQPNDQHHQPAHTAAFSSGNIFGRNRTGAGGGGVDLGGSTSITSLVEKKELDGSLNRSGIKRKRFSFENSFKEEEETAKKMAELEKLLRQTQAELIESRALTTKLEQQKMELTRNHAEKIIQFEKSHNEMRIKTREAVEMAEECKTKLDKKIKELEEKNDKYHKEFTERAEKVASLEQKAIELESENMELKSKLQEEKSGQNTALNKSNLELEETEKGAEKWVMDCQILQGQLELKDQLIAKYQEELKEAQAQLISTTSKRNANSENTNKEPDSDSEAIDIEGNTVSTTPSRILDTGTSERMKTLENMFAKQQIENNKLSETVQKLTKENTLMKSSINKEMLLQEEIISLENEVKLLRDLLKKKADVEVVRDSLKDQVESWLSVASKVDQVNATPQNLENFIKQTQQSLIEFKHENAALSLRLSSTNANMVTCQKDLATSKNQIKLLEDEKNQLSSDLKQLSHKLMLVTKDRDGLKCLNESYGQELENVISGALTKRIVELEELVREYEIIVNEDPSAKKPCRECETRMKLVSDLKNELDKLKAEKESFLTNTSNTTFADESGLNTTGVKVVTFGMNPSALTLEGRIQELISENKKLNDRIKYLEDQSLGGLGDSFMIEEKNNLAKELAELNRKYDALREDYNFELHQNQVVMTKLFGFNVTFVKDTSAQIRLQSIYSPNVEDFFVFQENENEMMLMETAVLAQYRAEIEKYLVTEGSISAFLSYITISLASGVTTQVAEVEDSSVLPSSQEQESMEDETMNTIEVQPSGRKTVQVEIEGESDNDDGSDGDGEEEEAEEEEEYDEDDREEDYSESDGESEDDGRNEKHGRVKKRETRDNDSDSDDVVCIDSD